MKKKLLLLLLALQLITVYAQNEVNFHKNYYAYEPNHYRNGFSLIAKRIIEDKLLGGYFIIGRENFSGGPNQLIHNSIFVAKIDANGEYLWVKNQGSTKYEYSDITQMSNGQLLFGDGKTRYKNVGNYGEGFRMSVSDNSYSSVLWEKDYSIDEDASCRAVIESFSFPTQITDGVVGCGTTNFFQGGVLCVKANQTTGAIIWSRTYNFGGTNEGANDICQTEDGGYAVTGYSDASLLLFKIDINGNLIWSQKIDLVNRNSAEGTTILNTPDAVGYSIVVGGNSGNTTPKAFVLKRNNAGVMTVAMSSRSESTTIHSMQMRNNNSIMISGGIITAASEKSYISTLNLSNISNTIIAREFDVYESRSTIVTSDNSFITTGSIMSLSDRFFYVFKTKSDGLVKCLGSESIFPMSTQSFTPLSQAINTTTNSYIVSLAPNPLGLQKETKILCCYVSDAIIDTLTLHVKCNERINLTANCDGESIKWFDENDQEIAGNTTHVLSFKTTHATHRTAREYDAGGCVRCEKRFEIIVDPPDVCFTLPETICINQPIVPVLTCDMSKVNWHQWVVTELNGAWENRVVKGSFPFGGPPSAPDIRTLWNGFIPGKCYGISLDIQDSCGNNNTLYQFFCIPAIVQETITLTVCPLNGNTSRWFEPSPHCSGAYYIFLGNDSRDYPYGYPLGPGTYTMDCFDASGCQIKQLVVQVIPVAPQTTNCHKTEYYCDIIPNPEGILPGAECPNCYRNDPRVEVFPLETETVNGEILYKRKIIDWENCRECNFSFNVVDKACDFVPDFTYQSSAQNPEHITFTNISTSGPGTSPCGNVSWNIQDLSSPYIYGFFGQIVNFTGIVGHTYRVCLSVTNCACGRECTKTICRDILISPEGLMRLAGNSEDGSIVRENPATELPLEVGIKPNPSSGKFVLFNLSGLQSYKHITISTMDGKKLFDQDNVPADFEYNLAEAAKGVYVISINTGDAIKNLKLVLN